MKLVKNVAIAILAASCLNGFVVSATSSLWTISEWRETALIVVVYSTIMHVILLFHLLMATDES